MVWQIYVLKLKHGKYYVGKTKKDPQRRFEEHKKGRGSQWTRKYPALELIETKKFKHKFDEDIETKKYMDKFGIKNVRGGSYCQIELSDGKMSLLRTELNPDACHSCGGKDHFVDKCKISKANVANKNQLSSKSKQIKKTSKKIKLPKQESQGPSCQRCGGKSHQTEKCKDKTHSNGKQQFVSSDGKCFRCFKGGHYTYHCREKTNVDGQRIKGR